MPPFSFSPPGAGAALDLRRVGVEVQMLDAKCVGQGGRKLRKRRVLQGVTGRVRPGEMVAVMGASGGGKTTLLDAVARRPAGGKATWKMHGTVLLDGQRVTTRIARRQLAYVEQASGAQQSVFSVEETLLFAAACKLRGVSREDRRAKCEQAIADMRLGKCRGTQVGREELGIRGVSGGEKRRLAVAVAMLGDPRAFLMDEPTSGLDSAMALEVMQLVRERLVAQKGLTLVVTIHQPSGALYELFDSLVLLSHGRCAYWGPAGGAPLEWFSRLGRPYVQGRNVTEFLIDTLDAEPAPPPEAGHTAGPPAKGTFAHAWEESELHRATDEAVEEAWGNWASGGGGRGSSGAGSKASSNSPAGSAAYVARKVSCVSEGEVLEPTAAQPDFANGPLRELWVLMRYRLFLKMRQPWFALSRIAPIACQGLIYASFFSNTRISFMGSVTMSGFLFVSIVLAGFLAIPSMEDIKNELPKMKAERRDLYYRPSSFVLEKFLQELPMAALGALAFGCVTYFAVGLHRDPGKFFFYVLVVFVNTMNSIGLSFAFVANLQVVILPQALAMIWNTLNILCSGFFVVRCDIPRWWSWLYWISYQQWGWSALMLNEFKDSMYFGQCQPAGAAGGGPTCGGPFGDINVDSLAGALLGGTAVNGCVPFQGDWSLQGYGLEERDKWMCLLWCSLTFPATVLLAYFGVWRTTRR